MSKWNPVGMTGTNNVPLGNRRRFGSDRGQSETPTLSGEEYNPSAPSNGFSETSSVKRGRSPVRGKLLLISYPKIPFRSYLGKKAYSLA